MNSGMKEVTVFKKISKSKSGVEYTCISRFQMENKRKFKSYCD